MNERPHNSIERQDADEADTVAHKIRSTKAPHSGEESESNDAHEGTQAPKIGETVAGRYKIVEILGSGGMGIVYKVEQIFFHGEVFALKLLRTCAMSNALVRFQKEAQAARRLNHPNLIRVHDFGLTEHDVPFLVMDYADGTPLGDEIKRQGRLSIAQALAIFLQVCDGLSYAHEQGVVHRDLKPSNIVISRVDGKADHVRIVDFGIAKILQGEGEQLQALTRTGEIFGSPLYMSPEQCLGSTVDARSDIYSFGCSLFEALTGVTPFIGENALATMMKHQSSPPPSLKETCLGQDFPAALETIVSTLLAKDPLDRYQSMQEVKHHLTLAMGGQVLPPRLSVVPSTNVKPLIAMVACAVLIACAAILVLFAQSHNEAPEPAKVIAQHDDTGDFTGVLKEVLGGSVPIPDEPYASVPLDKARGKPWVLNFPQESLGWIGVGSGDRLAKGTITFASAGPLYFKPSFSACEKPSIFRGFRADELETLSMSDNPNVDDNMLLYLQHLTGLKCLMLISSDITDAGLEHIKGLPNLTELKVGQTKGVTGAGLAKMVSISKMRDLGADHISKVSVLIAALQKDKTIENLYLRVTDLTDADLADLSRLKTLQRLAIGSNPKVTNAGIAHLTALQDLHYLDLWRCSITPDCINHLVKMPKLQELYIYTKNWSASDIQKLHEALPKCIIDEEHNH